jgi:hypothetical protein
MNSECAGLIGWLTGHQFIKTCGGFIYKSDHCWRCGKRKGN